MAGYVERVSAKEIKDLRSTHKDQARTTVTGHMYSNDLSAKVTLTLAEECT